MMCITVLITVDWTIPAYFNNERVEGGVTLTPILEILCHNLRYPTTPQAPAYNMLMLMNQPGSAPSDYMLYANTAEFMGITTQESAVKRILPGGHKIFGDVEAPGTLGSMTMQVSLPNYPGTTLPVGTVFSFQIIAGATGFTDPEPGFPCVLAATYTDPSAVVTEFSLRDRYYRYANGTGTLMGDGVMYSDMFTVTTATATTSARIDIAVELTSAFTIPAFLDNEQVVGGVTLAPVLEVACFGFPYGDANPYDTTSLEMSVTAPDVEYISTVEAKSQEIGDYPSILTPAVMRIVAGGGAVIGDVDATDDTGSLLIQVDMPLRPGKSFTANSEFRLRAPTADAADGGKAFSPIGTLQCYFGFTTVDPAAPEVDWSMRDRYYNWLNGPGTLDATATHSAMTLFPSSV
jgi:hypothetical protein